MLTILASFASEESKSVSDNCKWRIRKDFSAGKPMHLPLIYGYRREKGRIVIDEQEAEIVRFIFHPPSEPQFCFVGKLLEQQDAQLKI